MTVFRCWLMSLLSYYIYILRSFLLCWAVGLQQIHLEDRFKYG
jgi:hypothetical protein